MQGEIENVVAEIENVVAEIATRSFFLLFKISAL
jgi:hypothetical protein